MFLRDIRVQQWPEDDLDAPDVSAETGIEAKVAIKWGANAWQPTLASGERCVQESVSPWSRV